ncbi:MAG: hypothetical protein ACUVQN_05095 [Caldisericia bacterium]
MFKKNKLKIYLIIAFLLFSITVGIIYELENSLTVNHALFNIINPYDPLNPKKKYLTNNFTSDSTNWVEPRSIFPILGYNIPSGTINLEASLRIIENGGINILINGNFGWMPDPLRLVEALSKQTESNLKLLAIIENECKDDFIYCNTNDETNKNISKYLDLFNQEYIYGWYVWDEPGKNRRLCSPFNLEPNDDFEDINRIVKQIRQNHKYNDKLDFINLFPTYWSETKTLNDYEKYLNAFYTSQEYKPRVLCFDHYPFLMGGNSNFRKDYYANLEIIRKKSIEWDIPFWMIILSSGHDNYKNPSFEEIRFQIYSALAYGAKGIGYYLYSKSFEQIGYRSWILENYVDDEQVADSLHGPLYVPIKKLNAEIKKLGGILMNLKSRRIIHTSDFPNNQLNISFGLSHQSNTESIVKDIISFDSLSTQKNFLIGEFSNENLEENYNYLLIVNKDYNQNCDLKILFSESKEIFKFNKNSGKFERIGFNNFINLSILAGDGELVLLR